MTGISKRSKQCLFFLLTFFLIGLVVGCSSTAPKLRSAQIEEDAKKRAMDLFIEGKVAESKQEYGNAIAAYIEALHYDPGSAEINQALASVFIQSGKILSARDFAKRATELDPINAEAWRLLQSIEQHEGDFENAIESLQMYMKLTDKKDFNDIIKLSYLYFSIGNKEKGRDVILSNVKDRRTTSSDMVQAARLLEINGLIDDGASIYNLILERDPSDVMAWVYLGMLYSDNGRDEDAGKMFEEALKKNPDSTELRLAMGNQCLMKNNWECAISYYEQSLGKTNKDVDIRSTLCALYFYSGRDSDGVAAFNALKEQNNDNAQLYFSLGKAMNYLNRYEQAVDYYHTGFTKLTEPLPEKNLVNAYSGLTQSLIKLGRVKEAIDLIHTEANEKIKDKSVLKLIESKLYLDLKRYDDAISILEWLSSSDPENTSFYIQLSLAYDLAGRFKDAEKALLEVLKREPDHALALNNLAYMYMDHDVNIKKAVKMVQQALLLEPDNGAYNDTLGWGYYKLGKYKEARKYIEAALKLADEHDEGVIYEHHGDVLSRLHKPKEAAEAYQKAIQYGEDKERIQPKINVLKSE